MARSGDGTVGDSMIDEAIHQQRFHQRGTAKNPFKMPKLTLTALQGPVAGVGPSLALACDLRFMSSNAITTKAFAKVEFSGNYGGAYFVAQLVGSAKARKLYYRSERVNAKEALGLGLANWVCEPEVLLERAVEIAQRLAARSTVAYRYMKENINRAMCGDVDECLDSEAINHVHCGQTEDHKEAAKAFVEKRESAFGGARKCA